MSLMMTTMMIPVSSQLKSLSVITDSHMCFDSHVWSELSSGRATTTFVPCDMCVNIDLTTEMAQTIACSVISSRIDYCNSLLYGASVAVVEKLQSSKQRHQSYDQRKCVSARWLLNCVHWLPVQQRIQYRIAVIMHKALSTSVPPYIDELLQRQVTTRSLRSTDAPRLSVPWTHTKIVKRAFCMMAPNVRNSVTTEWHLQCHFNVKLPCQTEITLFTVAYSWWQRYWIDF